jgi:tetratricopeptide (TPR) repeat protein
MKRFRMAIAMAGALVALTAGVGAEVGTEVALRAAMEKETVKGDLKGAIDQYKKLAQGKDRAVAAKALVRMGQCYEKLGDAEARKAYERVVREYADHGGGQAPDHADSGTGRRSRIHRDRSRRRCAEDRCQSGWFAHCL